MPEFVIATINISFLIITLGFMVLYFVSFIMNIVRASKALKQIKTTPKTVKATITEITQDKHNVYVKFKYSSPINRQSFNDIITLSKSDFKDQYYVDQEIDIVYPDTTASKRVYYFPRFLLSLPSTNR